MAGAVVEVEVGVGGEVVVGAVVVVGVGVGVVAVVEVGAVVVVGVEVVMTYLLLVFTLECGIPCYSINNPREGMTFEDCRTNKDLIETMYLMSNIKVWGVCRRNDDE